MLAVILFHVNRDWLPGGFIGVDIFLVISGFLITSIILHQKREGSFSFLSFYIARIKRIVPAYLVLLAVTSLFMMVLLIPQDFNSYKKSLLAALYFNSNHFFANEYDYFAPAAHELPLLHTWSLAVEMQFYLLLPAILTFIPRRFLGLALLIAGAAILSYSSFQIAQGHREAQYFSLAARIPEFLLGCLLALQPIGQNWNDRTSNFAAGTGLLLILGSFWFINEKTAFPGLLTLPPCIGATLLLAASKSGVNRRISSTAFVWIGNLSYSLYLWHWPVLAGFRYFLETYNLPISAVLGCIALTVTCSYASYRYVELPFRRKRSTTGLIHATALATGVLMTIWVSHLVNPKLVTPLPKSLTRYAQPSKICHAKIVGDCLRGDRSANRTLLMLGDSHAAQLNYFADEVGNAINAKIRVISASACVTIPGFDVERIGEGLRPACRSQIEKAKDYIQSSDAIILAGKWRSHSKSNLFMEALDQFLREAASRNQQVIVLAQVPMLTSNVQRAYRFQSLGLSQTNSSMEDRWESANDQIQKLVANHKNSIFLNLAKHELFADAPFENGVLLYHDSQHLNEIGSRRYGEVASPYFTKWLGAISKAN